jgi:hypothetical protein
MATGSGGEEVADDFTSPTDDLGLAAAPYDFLIARYF